MIVVFCLVILTSLCSETLIEFAEAPTWKPAATIGVSNAAVSVIDRPNDVAAPDTSGNASAISFNDNAVLFSIKLKIAN